MTQEQQNKVKKKKNHNANFPIVVIKSQLLLELVNGVLNHFV